MDVHVVHATPRTNWVFIRLHTDKGLSGLGEATLGGRTPVPLEPFFDLVKGQSPFAINAYRARGRPRVLAGGRPEATAFSAIEQAMWDIVGKAVGLPVSTLLGGPLVETLPVYANINRATSDRSPEGFAAQATAARDAGFRAIKAAPFDGFPALTEAPDRIKAAAENGIEAMRAMRRAVGDDVGLMVDCHSHFDVALAVEMADELAELDLYWYEEPVAPAEIAATLEIGERIEQRMAGGEMLFGIEGFAPLVGERAYDVIMPDVRHCGGLLECVRIGTIAEVNGIEVAPHNPAGPVATAASAQVSSVMSNFTLLEYAWGEVDWRADLLDPPEQFVNGQMRVSDAPGLGIELNQKLVEAHAA
jgi:galactonate dehydratase